MTRRSDCQTRGERRKTDAGGCFHLASAFNCRASPCVRTAFPNEQHACDRRRLSRALSGVRVVFRNTGRSGASLDMTPLTRALRYTALVLYEAATHLGLRSRALRRRLVGSGTGEGPADLPRRRGRRQRDALRRAVRRIGADRHRQRRARAGCRSHHGRREGRRRHGRSTT